MTTYWRRSRLLTMLLLAVWASMTALVCFLAPALNQLTFLGFPLGFYFAAQGVLVLYLGIVGFYAWYMNRFDKRVKDERT